MPRYAAFLRAVNLGPNRKVSSADLRTLFGQLGFDGVETFRTSGNVVFEGGGSQAAIAKRIEEGLSRLVGGAAKVFLRSEKDVRALAAHEPFPRKLVEASDGRLQVVLLDRRPPARAQAQVAGLATDEDRLEFGARELYWLPSGGIRDSGLNFRAIEKLLGENTIRTKGTIEQLASKYFS